MPRIPTVTGDRAEQSELLERTRRQLGRVPNLYAAMAVAPAALRGYLALRDELSAGVTDARLREQLALLIAHENGCGYCVAAHSLRGQRMGMSAEQLRETCRAEEGDQHTRGVLRAAREIMRTGGRLTDAQVAKARRDGVTDAEFAEIVAHIALNTLANYYNHLAQPELDFPVVAMTAPEGADPTTR